MTWKHGGTFGFCKPADDLDFDTSGDPRGCYHAVARNGEELRHYVRGSRNPYPWESEGRVIPGRYAGSGGIKIWNGAKGDGNLQVIWPDTDGKNQAWWANPDEFEDPSDGDDPPLPKHQENHVGWIGLLPWMMNNPDADLDEFFKRTSNAGVSCIRSFCWVGDPSKDNFYTFKCLPWILVEEYRVDFNLLNPLFEVQFKKLASYCKKYDMDFMPIYFMDRYNDHIFSLDGNVNGIADKYDDNARPIVLGLVERCIGWLKEVYGQDYKPYGQPINEAAHYGRNDLAHAVADFNRDVGDKILESTDYDHLVLDASLSDFVAGYFSGRYNSDGSKHLCPLCPKGEEVWFGRDEFEKRPVYIETHGASTIQGFYDGGFDAWIGSAWPGGGWNEDGSFDGSIEVILNGKVLFRQANTEELTDSLSWAMEACDVAGKKFLWGCFPFDPLEVVIVNGEEILMENYHRWREFNFDRVRVFSTVKS